MKRPRHPTRRSGTSSKGALLTVVVCTASLSCSFVYSLDGYVSAEQDDVVVEAGGNTDFRDVELHEASSANDGSSSYDADASSAPFCELALDAKFCDDFDKGNPVGFGWTSLANLGGGTIVKEDATVRSAPSSIRLLSPGDAGGVTRAALVKSFTDELVGYRCVFDLWIERYGQVPGHALQIAALKVSSSDSFLQANLNLSTLGVVSLSKQVSSAAVVLGEVSTAIAEKTWTHFDFELALGTAPATRLQIDSQQPISFALSSDLVASSWSFTAGLNYVQGPNESWDIIIDNVACWSR